MRSLASAASLSEAKASNFFQACVLDFEEAVPLAEKGELFRFRNGFLGPFGPGPGPGFFLFLPLSMSRPIMPFSR